jgi:hypothetical protein
LAHLLQEFHTNWHLKTEYLYSKEVEGKLLKARDTPLCSEEERKRQRQFHVYMVLYLSLISLFLVACFAISRFSQQAQSATAPVIMRMKNKQQFTVIFNNELPNECATSSTLKGAQITMAYDPTSHSWIAPGLRSTKTTAAYPEKHRLIIEGAGFWFDDDGQVYRSCGTDELQVARLYSAL